MLHRSTSQGKSSLRWASTWCLLLASASWAQQPAQAGSQWVRPSSADQPLIWGRRDGIVFGLISKGGIKGPRGLIRIGVYKPGEAQPELLNYIAVEPVVSGPGERFSRMAFSELEMSQLDPGQRGKRMSVHPGAEGRADSSAGLLQTLHSGKATIERLSVRIDVERFQANGAHVYVIASIDSDHPDELRLTPGSEADGVPLEESVVTATMGNYERLRLLWLNDKVVDSRTLFKDYDGLAFVEKYSYPLPQMLRTDEGGAIVFCSSNEMSPTDSKGNQSAHWVYTLPKYTQYWRVGGSDVQPDLRVRVNARRVYWSSTSPVLGGVAFENFELRQRYVPGATFIFGVTRSEPWDFYKGPGAVKAWIEGNVDNGESSRSTGAGGQNSPPRTSPQ